MTPAAVRLCDNSAMDFRRAAEETARQLGRGYPTPPALRFFAGDGLQTAYLPAPLFPVKLNQFWGFPRIVNQYLFVRNRPYVRSVLP